MEVKGLAFDSHHEEAVIELGISWSQLLGLWRCTGRLPASIFFSLYHKYLFSGRWIPTHLAYASMIAGTGTVANPRHDIPVTVLVPLILQRTGFTPFTPLRTVEEVNVPTMIIVCKAIPQNYIPPPKKKPSPIGILDSLGLE